jgi:hypothetical protein
LLRKSIWDEPADISDHRLLKDIQVSCQIVARDIYFKINDLIEVRGETTLHRASILHRTLNN